MSPMKSHPKRKSHNLSPAPQAKRPDCKSQGVFVIVISLFYNVPTHPPAGGLFATRSLKRAIKIQAMRQLVKVDSRPA